MLLINTTVTDAAGYSFIINDDFFDEIDRDRPQRYQILTPKTVKTSRT